jgi:hypothetical protein
MKAGQMGNDHLPELRLTLATMSEFRPDAAREATGQSSK